MGEKDSGVQTYKLGRYTRRVVEQGIEETLQVLRENVGWKTGEKSALDYLLELMNFSKLSKEEKLKVVAILWELYSYWY